jgi:excisionase family DNA binding protein
VATHQEDITAETVTPCNREDRRHPDRLAHPVPETAELIGCGTTKTRELIANGELRAIRIDRRLLVPRSEIEQFIARKLQAS